MSGRHSIFNMLQHFLSLPSHLSWVKNGKQQHTISLSYENISPDIYAHKVTFSRYRAWIKFTYERLINLPWGNNWSLNVFNFADMYLPVSQSLNWLNQPTRGCTNFLFAFFERHHLKLKITLKMPYRSHMRSSYVLYQTFFHSLHTPKQSQHFLLCWFS